MAKVYFQLFACFCFALKWEGNVEASDSLRCEAVKTAIKLNSTWTVRSDQKVISWRSVATAATVLKQCTCNAAVVELGDISRIQYTNSTTGAVYFNNLCSGCPGLQVPVTDFNYSVGVIENGTSHTDTGPCSEVPVYRCGCQNIIKFTTPKVTTPLTTAWTIQTDPPLK